MKAYARVVPYLCNSKCLKVELVTDTPRYFGCSSIAYPEKLLKLFAATQNSIYVDSLRIEMGDVNAKLVEGRR